MLDNELELAERPEGVLLLVRAHAGARRNRVSGIRNGRLLVEVTQVPERGKANVAIAKMLAKQLGLRGSQIALVSGDTNPEKTLAIAGITATELQHRCREALSGLT